MTLIKSISGIRGTIGGNPGDSLTPVDAVKFASAYGSWLKKYSQKKCIEHVFIYSNYTIPHSYLISDSFIWLVTSIYLYLTDVTFKN